MFVNLTDVLTNEGKTVSMQVETELTQVSIGKEQFPVTDKTPVDLVCTNVGKGKAIIHGTATVTVALRCSRCLRPVEKKFELVFDREVYRPDAIEDSSDESDDQRFMDGYQMNVEDLLNNEIVINWPMKVLCKPDCKGICSVCGKDLNTGTCDCDTFVPDPRMAVIKDIFNADKEV